MNRPEHWKQQVCLNNIEDVIDSARLWHVANEKAVLVPQITTRLPYKYPPSVLPSWLDFLNSKLFLKTTTPSKQLCTTPAKGHRTKAIIWQQP
jgi:hypothetical protein